MEHGWAQGHDLLTSRDVLVIDEAGMVGTRQMEHLLSHAQEAGAKVVLDGDLRQLQAIEAGAAFRSIVDRISSIEITDMRQIIGIARTCDEQRRCLWQRAAGGVLVGILLWAILPGMNARRTSKSGVRAPVERFDEANPPLSAIRRTWLERRDLVIN